MTRWSRHNCSTTKGCHGEPGATLGNCCLPHCSEDWEDHTACILVPTSATSSQQHLASGSHPGSPGMTHLRKRGIMDTAGRMGGKRSHTCSTHTPTCPSNQISLDDDARDTDRFFLPANITVSYMQWCRHRAVCTHEIKMCKACKVCRRAELPHVAGVQREPPSLTFLGHSFGGRRRAAGGAGAQPLGALGCRYRSAPAEDGTRVPCPKFQPAKHLVADLTATASLWVVTTAATTVQKKNVAVAVSLG